MTGSVHTWDTGAWDGQMDTNSVTVYVFGVSAPFQSTGIHTARMGLGIVTTPRRKFFLGGFCLSGLQPSLEKVGAILIMTSQAFMGPKWVHRHEGTC